MCIGVPMKIVSVDGLRAMAANDERREEIDLSLTGPLEPGTWVLTFLGAARDVLDEDEAKKIAAAVEALQRVMAGGDMGDAFADLEARGPQLPPHLAAAAAAGRTTG